MKKEIVDGIDVDYVICMNKKRNQLKIHKISQAK